MSNVQCAFTSQMSTFRLHSIFQLIRMASVPVRVQGSALDRRKTFQN